MEGVGRLFISLPDACSKAKITGKGEGMTENFNAHPAQIELARIFSSDYLLGPPLSEQSVRLVCHLFTPEEAEVARHLPFYYPRKAEKIAKRANRKVEEIAPILEKMSEKRVILKLRNGYALIPLIPGIFEYSLWSGKDTEWHREFARQINALYATGYARKYNKQGKVPAIRIIPVQSIVPVKSQVVDEALFSELLKHHTDFGVLNVCQCRQAAHFSGKDCKRSSPEDGCLLFGSFATGAIKRGDARRVSRSEMESIAKERWEKKLVFWSSNVNPRNPNAICTCCDCCCHLLESVNRFGGKTSLSQPRFKVQYDSSVCTDCGLCVKACNTYAHTLFEKKHRFDQGKCIGCGVCVQECKGKALKLVENPEYARPYPSYKSLLLKVIIFMTWARLKMKFQH